MIFLKELSLGYNTICMGFNPRGGARGPLSAARLIRQLSDFYVFQQDSAPAHMARETIELLTTETPEFIPPTLWPPNSPDLNPVDYFLMLMTKSTIRHYFLL